MLTNVQSLTSAGRGSPDTSTASVNGVNGVKQANGVNGVKQTNGVNGVKRLSDVAPRRLPLLLARQSDIFEGRITVSQDAHQLHI
ncbi:hypothetical protein E4U43_003665 [Claviceps pusilla]|uniref:Uncharacterized protein n=1 Tax=Claviceps pusilla TaxID=123648 RepID=A0A9P7NFJ7_9HYPO|nr:hypothetical protein E4U43_003665 [Claviceps pusilla]